MIIANFVRCGNELEAFLRELLEQNATNPFVDNCRRHVQSTASPRIIIHRIP